MFIQSSLYILSSAAGTETGGSVVSMDVAGRMVVKCAMSCSVTGFSAGPAGVWCAHLRVRRCTNFCGTAAADEDAAGGVCRTRDRGSRRAVCRDSIIVAEDRLGVTDGEERVVGERE